MFFFWSISPSDWLKPAPFFYRRHDGRGRGLVSMRLLVHLSWKRRKPCGWFIVRRIFTRDWWINGWMTDKKISDTDLIDWLIDTWMFHIQFKNVSMSKIHTCISYSTFSVNVFKIQWRPKGFSRPLWSFRWESRLLECRILVHASSSRACIPISVRPYICFQERSKYFIENHKFHFWSKSFKMVFRAQLCKTTTL